MVHARGVAMQQDVFVYVTGLHVVQLGNNWMKKKKIEDCKIG